jgi:MFS-type transporter involved in bile tolerance (Atg22 family)
VPRPVGLTALLVIGCFAFMGVGIAFATVCDGGYALMLFGAAVGCLGALLYRTGAWATIIPFAIIVLCLVGGGYYGLTVAGCGW